MSTLYTINLSSRTQLRISEMKEKILKQPHIYYGFLAQLFIMATDSIFIIVKLYLITETYVLIDKGKKCFATSSTFCKYLSLLSFPN